MKIIINHILNYSRLTFVAGLLIVLSLFSSSAYAVDKNNAVILTKAELYYEAYKYAQAAPLYEKFLNDNQSASIDVKLKLADCFWNMRMNNDAIRIYDQISSHENITDERLLIRIADLYARNNDYDSAAEWLIKVGKYKYKASTYASKEAIQKMKTDSLDWHLNLLNINTEFREFSSIVKDSSLIFSSNMPQAKKTKAFGWDGHNYLRLWQVAISGIDTLSESLMLDSLKSRGLQNAMSKKIADVYECGDTKSSVNINRVLIQNLSLNPESGQIGQIVKGLKKFRFNAGSISIDKNNNVYFSTNYKRAGKDGINRIRLMSGIYSNGKIKSVKPLDFGDSKSYSVMHPAINADGTILIFSSDKKEGNGNYDLYYTTRLDSKSEWAEMKPLSSKVNSVGNEVFPVIGADGKLCYSSDGLPGLGGLDIYSISIEDAISGKTTPKHLGYPLNTSADDFGYFVSTPKADKGYLTSDRKYDNDNIYSFSYLERFDGKYFLRGKVIDDYRGIPIAGATVFIYKKQNKKVYVTKTDSLGYYSYGPLESLDFIVKASAKNYEGDCLSALVNFKPIKSDSTLYLKDLRIGAVKLGETFRLSYIHYDFDKFYIRPDARPILDSVVDILNKYPIKVELGSHTDSRGSVSYNDVLSQNRANAARRYLIKSGISENRISAKGYGERNLLNRCSDGVNCSAADHQANRRTEIKIIGFTKPINNDGFNPDIFKDGQEIDLSELPVDFFKDCN